MSEYTTATPEAADALRFLRAHGCQIELDAFNFYYRSVVLPLPRGRTTLATMGSSQVRDDRDMDFEAMLIAARYWYEDRMASFRGQAEKECRKEMAGREYDAAKLRCGCGQCRWSEMFSCWVWRMTTLGDNAILRAGSGQCSQCGSPLPQQPSVGVAQAMTEVL